MSSTQGFLTETFTVRKTRSHNKKIVNHAMDDKCLSLRPRRCVTRLFANESQDYEKVGRKPVKDLLSVPKNIISFESVVEQTQRNLSWSRKKQIEDGKENEEQIEPSCEESESPSKFISEGVTQLSPRKNLISIFDSISGNEPTDFFQSPVRTPDLFDSPRRSPRKTVTPTKSQENFLQSPNRTPKRQSTEQLRLAVTSPPKRKKDIHQKTFTPIALFKQNVSSFHAAKEALHSSTPSRLIGRERQINDLSEFLEEHLLLPGGKPGSMYISGAPGTGKTACLTKLLSDMKDSHDFLSIFLNCMSINHSEAIFKKIASALGDRRSSSVKDTIQVIERKICNQKHPIVLVLDEMDQLSTKNQQVLYSVFEWLRLPNSNLVLIGIANTLNMTGQILPRLDTCRCPITLLHFPTYSQTQITAILQDRLKDLTCSQNCVIKPQALQFCARKIAAQAGDVRKALDTCRRAVELVEKFVRNQQVLRTTFDDGQNPGSPRRSPRTLAAACVDLSHIQKVLHDIYGSRVVSSKASESDLGSSMPIQQKLLLCTLLLITKNRKRTTDLTLSKLGEVYCKVCHNHKMEEVAFVDFQSMCSLAESKGLVQIRSHKETRLSKIILNVDEDELQFIMKDKSLLAAVLQDQSVLR